MEVQSVSADSLVPPPRAELAQRVAWSGTDRPSRSVPPALEPSRLVSASPYRLRYRLGTDRRWRAQPVSMW
jgi:hypothetical protein